MRLGPETIERVRSMWARWAAEGWPDDFEGVSVVSFAGERFVRAPAHLAHFVRDDPPDDLDTLAARLGDHVIRRSGSALLAYGEASTLRLASTDGVVPVGDDDPRIARLEARAETAEWLEASADEPAEARVGVVEDGELIALATLQVWDGAVGHFGVYTHHDSRGRGLAARTASAVIDAALARGLVPQWRARIDNDASIAVADRLGFATGGHQIFVRVRPAAS